MSKGLVPQPVIDDIIIKTDIVTLIEQYVPLKKRGNNFIACCPFHHEKTPSFNVVAKKQFFHCFGCGESGNVISFLMKFNHLSFMEALMQLAEKLDIRLQGLGTTQHTNFKQSKHFYHLLHQVTEWYQKQLQFHGMTAIQYLKVRKINSNIAQLFKLGFAPEGWHHLESQFKHYKKDLIETGMLISKDNKTYDRYRHRLMFPIHNAQGKLVGFGGRALDDETKPKYLNSPETKLFQKNRELYGLYQALNANSQLDSVIVVEGYLDVLALHQFGFTNAVATLGTATTGLHIQLLSRHTSKIYFCFDGDEAGFKAAFRALESTLPYIHNGLDVRFCFLPKNHDPDTFIRQFGHANFAELLNKAALLDDYLVKTLEESLDLSSISGKTQLIERIKPFYNQIQPSTYQSLILKKLAQKTQMDDFRLSELLIFSSEGKKIEDTSPTRSPLRIAIALLLQNPTQCIELLNKAQLPSLTHPNYQIITDLLNICWDNKQITTAILIENWRDTKLFLPLSKLASWDHKVPDSAIAKEFEEIYFYLLRKEKEELIDNLLKKAREEGLNETDRLHLQKMLKQRQESLSKNTF